MEFREWRVEHGHHMRGDDGYMDMSAKLFEGDVWLADVEQWRTGRHEFQYKVARIAAEEIRPQVRAFLDQAGREAEAASRQNEIDIREAMQRERDERARAAIAALGLSDAPP